MRVCVFGLGHLGLVTAACLAEAGHTVTAIDHTSAASPQSMDEPGLPQLLGAMIRTFRLILSNELDEVADADLVWVTVEPTAMVQEQLKALRPFVSDRTTLLISSQVPVGFTRQIKQEWQRTNPTLCFAYSPENLRVGHALDDFRHPARVVIGRGEGTPIELLAEAFPPKTPIQWMSLESAEMVKHALNSYLAVSISFANEAARIGERLGVDWPDVERALRADPRVGDKAYIAAGPEPGPHLLREVNTLNELAVKQDIGAPVLESVLEWAQAAADHHRAVGRAFRAHADASRRPIQELYDEQAADQREELRMIGMYPPETDEQSPCAHA